MVTEKKYNEILKDCDQECFKFQDLIVNGDVKKVINNYLKDNPNKKFRTWIIDNNLNIK